MQPTDPPPRQQLAEPGALEQTRDDIDSHWCERPRPDSHEAWLRAERPPHWE